MEVNLCQPFARLPGGLFVAHTDPDGSGRRHVEFYHLNQLLESVGLNPGERRKACQP